MSDQSDLEKFARTDSVEERESEDSDPEGHGTARFPSLPTDWEIKRLDEVTTVQGGSTPSTDKDEYWGGDILWATPTDLTDLQENTISDTEGKITEAGLESSSTHVLPSYSVLLTSRASIGKCAVNTVPMATNQGFQSLIPGEEVNTWYLYYVITEMAPYLESLGAGSTFSEISKRTVQRVQIPVPPMEEQLRIASVLKNIDDHTRVNQEIINSSETLRVGTAERLFRYYDDTTTTHPMIGEYPAEWELPKLSDVCEVVDAEHFTPDYVDDGIALIRPGDMREGIISLDEVQKSVSEDTYDEMTRRHTPTNEDVLYSRSQNFAIASVVDTDCRFCIGQDMVSIKPNNVERDFLRHLLNSPLIRDQAKRRSTGTTFSRINLGDIRDLEIPIPSSEVQSEISEKLNTLEEYREMSQSAVEYSSVIAEGLSERLISGEIRTGNKQIEVSEKVLIND